MVNVLKRLKVRANGSNHAGECSHLKERCKAQE